MGRGTTQGADADASQLVRPPTLETPDCPLCASPRRSAPRYRFGPRGIVRCSECGLYYLSPRMNEAAMIAAYTAPTYFAGPRQGYESYASQEGALRATYRRLLSHLARRRMTGGALLEVGCAFGFFLDEARPFFDRRVGCDLSEAALGEAAARADTVVLGGLADVPESERFDCIVATQVIEHIYDPGSFVRVALQLLKPRGWLVLATPNIGSLWRHLLGRRWPSFKIPEHVTFFDARTLALLFVRAGCEDVQRLPYLHAFPLAVVAEKLGIPGRLRSVEGWLWIPQTTVAFAGRRGGG